MSATTTPASGSLRLTSFLALLAWTCLALAAPAMLLGRFWPTDLDHTGRAHVLMSWVAFMAGTFEFHIALAAAAAFLFALLLRRRTLALVAAIVAAGGLAPAAWSYRPRTLDTIQGQPLCVMSVNLLYCRADLEVLAEQVARVKPDVILFQEYTVAGAPALRSAFQSEFPYAAEHAESDAFGQAIYSRRPFSAPPRPFPPDEDKGLTWVRPQILAVIEHEGKQLGLLNIHLWTPISLGNVIEQRQQAAAIRRHARQLLDGKTVDGLVIAGDFNATERSPHLHALTDHGFTSALDAMARGRAGTWPRKKIIRFAPPIRLDHILVSEGLGVVWATVETDNGSDHRPVAARVGWR